MMTTLALQPCECRIRTWSLLLLAWVVSAIVLAASGALAASDLLIPALIGIPVAGFALGYRWNPAFREAALSLDTGVLVILHSWRMLGLGFLLLYAHDVLPGLFAWLAGAGDALAAVGATLIGIRLLRGNTVSRQALLMWNSFGLLDFASAVLVGTALRSAWLGGELTTDVMASLPLSLIPTLIVPFYVITHMVIFMQLRNEQHTRVPGPGSRTVQ
jgi:hypothetical protein